MNRHQPERKLSLLGTGCGHAPAIATASVESFVLNAANTVQIGMNTKHLPENHSPSGLATAVLIPEDLPLTVREAAVYLGVSMQTVYLWVERKQIPHLRVMGRNIRFLKSDLEPFRATFKQEVGIAKTE
jgi:excisionase family DNA binding protein